MSGETTTTNTSTTSENQGGAAGTGESLPQGESHVIENGAGQEGGAGVEGGEGESSEAKKHKPDPEKTAGRLQKRLARVHAERESLREENERMAQELAAVRRGRKPEGEGEATDEGGEGTGEARYTREDIAREAQRLANDREFSVSVGRGVERMMAEGEKAIPGFQELAEKVGSEIAIVDRQKRPTPFILAVIECPNSHEVMAHLAENDDLVDDLRDMTPRQQERRIVELSAELKHTKPRAKQSAAPKPLEPVKGRTNGGAGTSASIDDELNAIRAAR